MEGDNRLLAVLGYDADLDLALLDVKDGIRLVPLGEDSLIFAITRYGPALVHGVEEVFTLN